MLTRLDSDDDGDPPRLVKPILDLDIEDCEATDESVLEGDTTSHPTEENNENLTDFISSNSIPEPDNVNQDAETSALSDKGNFCVDIFAWVIFRIRR